MRPIKIIYGRHGSQYNISTLLMIDLNLAALTKYHPDVDLLLDARLNFMKNMERNERATTISH